MAKVNSVQLQKTLHEVSYPLDKKDLIMHAERTGVDEKILRALKHLPNQQYETPDEVRQAVDSIIMVRVDLVQLQNNLNEVDYPLCKKDLIMHAEYVGVDERILRILKQLPSREYQTSTDITNALGDI